MTIILSTILILLLVTGLGWLFLSLPATRLASLMTTALPIALIALGGLLVIVGRGGIGIPMAVLGLAWLRRMRGTQRMGSASPGQKSTVRSAAFDMELDHESGEMDGVVLLGRWEGQYLSSLDESELFDLLVEIRSDAESVALLEAYLDRRLPGWREDAQAHTGGRESSSPGPGSMTKEEAYQVLGLEPGASAAEIKAAWRKLMKTMHPDSGGSEFLAAKINAAKDVLLD